MKMMNIINIALGKYEIQQLSSTTDCMLFWPFYPYFKLGLELPTFSLSL